jgi:hypothetical protein
VPQFSPTYNPGDDKHEKGEPNNDTQSSGDCGRPSTGKPVIITNANKIYPETDFSSAGEMGLRFDRKYSKLLTTQGALGANWPSTLDYRLQFNYTNGASCTYTPGVNSPACSSASIANIMAVRPTGDTYVYVPNNVAGMYVGSAFGYITQGNNSWTYQTEDLGKETYSANGAPITVADAYGVSWTFSYSNNQITRITHASGRYISVA